MEETGKNPFGEALKKHFIFDYFDRTFRQEGSPPN